MGKSKSALPDLTKSIQLKPDFLAVGAPDRSLPSSLYYFLLSHFTSFALFQRAVVILCLHLDFFQARLQRGNILLKQGNTQEAREDFDAVVGLITGYPCVCVCQNKASHYRRNLPAFFSCSGPRATKKLRTS